MTATALRALEVSDRVLDFLERVFRVSAEFCLVMMLLANMLNIASRALLDKGVLWVFPWTVVLFVWMVFLCFYPVYRKSKDITVDFVASRLGRTGRFVADLIAHGVVLAVLAVFLLKAPALLSAQASRIEMVGLGRYVLSLPLFMSSALIFLHILLEAIRTIIGFAEAET